MGAFRGAAGDRRRLAPGDGHHMDDQGWASPGDPARVHRAHRPPADRGTGGSGMTMTRAPVTRAAGFLITSRPGAIAMVSGRRDHILTPPQVRDLIAALTAELDRQP